MDYHIISINKDKTKHGNDMYMCDTLEKERLFVFGNDEGLLPSIWERAGYSDELVNMPNKGSLRWESYPITVTAFKDGRWWNITHVEPKAEGANPDRFTMPRLSLYYDRVLTTLAYLKKESVAIFDTETTGLNTLTDEIVSIAVIDFSSNRLEEDNLFIRPNSSEKLLIKTGRDNKSPYDIHGIHPDDLLDKPTFDQVYPEIYDALAYTHWVAWNSDYDSDLLDNVCLRHSLPLIPRLGVTCAMKLISPLFSDWDYNRGQFAYKSLSDVADFYAIDNQDAHNAYADVLMTRSIMEATLEELATEKGIS